MKQSELPVAQVSIVADKAAGPRWTVRAFLVWLVLACLLPGIIAAAALFIHEYRVGLSELDKSTIQATRALVQAVDNQILRSQALAQGLAGDPSLAAGDLAAFHKRAHQALAQSKLGVSIVLVDRNDQQVLNTSKEFGEPLPKAGNLAAIRRVFDTGMSAVSDLFIGPVLGRPLIAVIVPVSVNGVVPYALGVIIPPEPFNAILRDQNLPTGWVATICDSECTIVARSREPEKWMGKKPAEAFLRQISAESSEGVFDFTMADGFPVRSHYSRSSLTNWWAVVNIPKETLQGELFDRFSVIALVVAGLFAVAFGLAWFVGGKISRSFQALVPAALALGGGRTIALPRVDVKEGAEVTSAMRQAAELLREQASTIRAREKELQEAQRLARLGSWYWNLETGAISASDSIREIFGRDLGPFSELRGTVLPVEAWERIKEAEEEAKRTGKGYSLEHEVNHGSGHRIWVLATCEAVRNEQGGVIGLRGAVQDITERKRVKQELEFLNAELERRVDERTADLIAANKELEGFTFATSHDLRGPLGRINSFSALLAQRYRDRLDGEGLLFIDFIRQNATRLSQLVDDLLSHARATRHALELRAVNVPALVEGVLRDKAEDIRETGTTVKQDIPPVEVLADSHALTTVLDNLFQNAMKYARPQEPPVIEIGGTRADGVFRLWVRDNGIGFDMAYHDRIFEIFRRLHTYDEYEGSGIGLALVKRAVERMGGKVWAESEPGQGATFFLELQAAT